MLCRMLLQRAALAPDRFATSIAVHGMNVLRVLCQKADATFSLMLWFFILISCFVWMVDMTLCDRVAEVK